LNGADPAQSGGTQKNMKKKCAKANLGGSGQKQMDEKKKESWRVFGFGGVIP